MSVRRRVVINIFFKWEQWNRTTTRYWHTSRGGRQGRTYLVINEQSAVDVMINSRFLHADSYRIRMNHLDAVHAFDLHGSYITPCLIACEFVSF
jgi:hypothetical protein